MLTSTPQTLIAAVDLTAAALTAAVCILPPLLLPPLLMLVLTPRRLCFLCLMVRSSAGVYIATRSTG